MDERFSELLTSFLPLLGDRPLSEDARLRDLGLDSMQSVNLLFGIEDIFEVSLPDEALNATAFETAGSLWKAVSAALDAKAAA